MKTTWLAVLFCFITFIKEIHTRDAFTIENKNAIINKYLRAQLIRATRTLEKSFEKKNRVKKYIREPDVIFNENVLRNNTYSPNLLLAQTEHSGVFAVDEKNIFKLNHVGDLEPVITFEHKRNPVSIEAITWTKQITLFLIKFQDDFSYVYQSTINKFPLQTIKLPVSSAKCFHHTDDIYCMLVMEPSNQRSVIRLFKWVDTHLDIQKSLEISLVSFVIAFNWKSDVLILLVPKYGQSKTSMLLRWNGDSLIKIQNIKFQTSCSECLRHMEFQTKHYIISDKVVLVWNGHRLVQTATLEHHPEFANALSIGVWSDEDNAIVFAFYKHNIVVHKYSEKFRIDQTRKVHDKIISALIVKSENDGNAIKYTSLFKNKIQLTTVPFSVAKKAEDIVGSEMDPLMQCFGSLQNVLLMNRDSINKLEITVPTVLRTDIPQNYSGVLRAGAATKVRSGTISSGSDNSYLTSPNELLMTVVELQKKSEILNNLRNLFLYKSQPNTISNSVYVPGGVVTVEGNLGSASVSMASGAEGIIFLESPTAPDSMETVLVAQSIKVNHLYTAPGTIIDDLLLSVGDQKVTGKFTGTNLILNNILPSSGQINYVPLENLVERGSDFVYGTKSIQTLFVNNLDTSLFNQMDTMSWINHMNSAFEGNYAIYENISVKNLNVDYVNGIKWNEFLLSLYLDIDGRSKIEGDLTFESRTRVHSANLQQIFGIPFENLLTKTTDQIITSNITISNLHADNVKAGSINGLNFKESIALPGTKIKNVEIEHLNVEKDLTLSDNSLFDKQIPGTKVDELLQMYNGKVVIKGSITISNLNLENNAKTFLQENEVFLNIPQYYWTKSSDQIIKSNVSFNKNVKAPQVYLDKLNSQDWTQYIAIDGSLSHYGNLIFEKAHIEGNLILDRNNNMYDPSIVQLKEQAVRLKGNYAINSDIEFTGEVHIKNADVQVLNETPVIDLISKYESQNIQFKGIKTVPYMNVSTLTAKTACATSLNGVDLENYFNSLLTVDKPASFDTLNIDSLSAEHLNLEVVNVMGTSDVHSENEQYRIEEDEESQKIIRINGNIHIEEIQGLQKINDVYLAEYLPLVVRLNSNAQISGYKVFEGPMTITEELKASIISELDLHNLYINGLLKSKEQNITGHYKISNITTNDFNAKYVNEWDMEQMIDISRPAQINSPIWFKAPLSVNNFVWSNSCYVNSLYEIPDKKWKSLYIRDHLSHPGLNKVLENLVENGVTDGFNKSIVGKVKFTGPTSFDNIVTLNHYINDVNFDRIVQDALLKNSTETKHISGYKTFVSQAVLSDGKISGDFNAHIINGVRIKEMNKSLVFKNEDATITGRKTLEQIPFVDNLQVEGLINGVSVDNVVFLEDNRPLPNVVFNSLKIKNSLQVREINGRNFDEFLFKRVRLRGEPQNVTCHMQFSELNIAGPSYVTKINDILLDDVVFTDLPSTEPILGLKVFEKGLKVDSDITVNYLNNFHLQTTYANSIKTNQDHYISHVTFLNPVQLLKGLNVHEYKNKSWLNFYAQPFPDTPYAEEIDKKINYTFSNIKPYYHYLYLEPSEINIYKPPSRKVKTIRSGFLHLWDLIPGESCYLPSFCPCSIQYTVEISNQRSVTAVPGNATLRIFSHNDDDIGVNIFTNTVSTSAFCSNANDEFTYVTWMKPLRDSPDSTPIGDITIDQQYYNGYLSDAKFFRDGSNRIFLVLAMYYDKTMDSHDIDSLLLELDSTQRKTTVIQYIPTRSATALELFQSSFGTYLVICNALQNEDVEAYFEVMKFDQNISQFKLLRTVTTEGCGLLASAVFGKEQFIFVGDQNFKILRISRYIEQSDMFYYFQSFIYDSYLRGLHIFYPQNSMMNEAFLCVTTDNGNFYIYVYTYIEGWKQISTGYLRSVHDVTYFKVNHDEFLFMSSTVQNMVFRIIRQGIP